MQLKPTTELTDRLLGDTKSIRSGVIAHALLKQSNQLLALMLTQRTSCSQRKLLPTSR